MEADPWSTLSSGPSGTRRRQISQQSRFEAYVGFEEADAGEDDLRVEFACPFCSEDFDIFGLCCHIDEEHPDEAKNGICPVCADRVGMDMVNHITTQHGNYFKMQRRRRYRKSSSSSHSALSLLKKEMRDGNLHTLLGGSSFLVPALESAPDPLLFSFINNVPPSGSTGDVKSSSLEEENQEIKCSDGKSIESIEPTLSLEDQEERTQRSAFTQGLMLSTIFEDTL